MNSLQNKEILCSFQELDAQDNTRKPRTRGNGILTIVNSEKNGNRILFSKQLEEDLCLTNGEIQILASKEKRALLIGATVPNAQNTYTLRRLKNGDSKSRYVIYNKGLMLAIADALSLDFSKCVSHTLYNVEYLECDNVLLALVTQGGEEHEE